MAKSHLKLVAPGTVNRTVTPRRLPNADLRTREYLTATEVERLLRATKGNRWAHRDATMILVAYRHGLRASELVDLRWEQVETSHCFRRSADDMRIFDRSASRHPARNYRKINLHLPCPSNAYPTPSGSWLIFSIYFPPEPP